MGLTKEQSLWPRKRGNKFTDQVFWKDEHVGQVWTCKPEDAKQVAATRTTTHYRTFDLNCFFCFCQLSFKSKNPHD
jgi:hypothetical protein